MAKHRNDINKMAVLQETTLWMATKLPSTTLDLEHSLAEIEAPASTYDVPFTILRSLACGFRGANAYNTHMAKAAKWQFHVPHKMINESFCAPARCNAKATRQRSPMCSRPDTKNEMSASVIAKIQTENASAKNVAYRTRFLSCA